MRYGTFLFDGRGNATDKFGDSIGKPETGKRHSRQDIALEWQGDKEQNGCNLGKPGQEKDEQGQGFGPEEVEQREEESDER